MQKIVDGYSKIAHDNLKAKATYFRGIYVVPSQNSKSGSLKIPLHSDLEEQLTKCEVRIV